MSELNRILELVQTHQIKQALIIDDAYDAVPSAEDLRLADLDAVASLLFDRASGAVKKALAAVLEGKSLEPDDYSSGLGDDDFVGKVWKLASSGKIAKNVGREIFGVFEAERTSKRKQLEFLEELLSKSKIGFTSQGRREKSDADGFQIIFLDLFLGVTDTKTAMDEAVDRIRGMLEDKSDEQRPLIVVMSTVEGVRLYELATELQQRAELLGCKFRAVNKEDFERALPKAITELLAHKDDAQYVAKWLDAWSSAIVSAANDYRRDMRLLDLSDLAYLSKFRLDAENTTLGEYLNSMSATYVQFCIEKQLASSREDKMLDELKFDKFPARHFLPSPQIPKLKHASAFVNDDVIRGHGYQFNNAKSVLQLGDLIVAKPKNWDRERKIALEEMPVFVVISQACDIVQGKSDALLLLRGTIRKRDWTAGFRNTAETTDVFIQDDQLFQIEWRKAQISAWPAKLADRRLSPNGDFLRISRFRDVEALKLQQIFASNLTRVGTIAAPHPHVDVGISFTAPSKDGHYTEIFKFATVQRMAAVMEVKPAKGDPYHLLVFNQDAAEHVAKNIEGVDLTSVKDPFAGQIKGLGKSPDKLAIFDVATKLSLGLDFGSGKIETKWLKKLEENKDKDPRKTKLVMALTTSEAPTG